MLEGSESLTDELESKTSIVGFADEVSDDDELEELDDELELELDLDKDLGFAPGSSDFNSLVDSFLLDCGL